ncbi:MAG: GNAT family N-acetyltransferase, partial [Bosea sp. (in: a-proteobacteria)]
MASKPDILIRPAVREDLPGIVHVFMGDDGSPKGDVWNEGTRPAYQAAFAAIAADTNQHLLVVEKDG